MKYILITLAVVLLIFTAAQAYIAHDLAKTEEQAYELIWKNDLLEARYYPNALLATVHGSSTEYRGTANQHFRVLAGYIFGGNDRGQSIAMTSPVHMSFGDAGSTMSFVMPASMKREDLPAPNDRGISFEESGEKYVVAIRFGGWADDEKISKHTDLLLKTLNTMGIEPKSSPWYMGYNPPFQLLNRRNEVAVEVSRQDMDIIKML
ncbi:MAG: heme-binding protein [Bacteroidetes bacterium]|nr:MAG: heme-binding protein [Bacteroidota bacterium]